MKFLGNRIGNLVENLVKDKFRSRVKRQAHSLAWACVEDGVRDQVWDRPSKMVWENLLGQYDKIVNVAVLGEIE